MATISPIPFYIQSVNTKAFAVSTPNDKPGQEVKTKPNRDEQTVLFTTIPIGPEGPVITEIIGVHPERLYVSVVGEGDKAKLIWSDKKFSWVVNKTFGGNIFISPANGADLFWVDERNVDHIQVVPGKDVRPPQNEWTFIPA